MKAWYFTVYQLLSASCSCISSRTSVPSLDNLFHALSFGLDRALGRTLRAEEFSRDVESLAADDDNLLAVQKLLGDSAGKTTKQVALAIDNNL